MEMVEPDRLAVAVAVAAGYRFDLSAEIPVQARVFRCGLEDHALVMLMHHIAGDGASVAPLARDMATAYAARRAGHEPGWAPLPVQYADYTLWQQQMLGEETDPGSVLAAQFGYWRQELAGIPECIDLPTDRPRPPVASYRGDTVPLVIAPQLRAAVEELARSRGRRCRWCCSRCWRCCCAGSAAVTILRSAVRSRAAPMTR
ncbi:condensation domain-containing protein (plasmid) [Rhodococcus opacus]|nr:condensation domain-containing protein [Rhodococcus opacus]UUK33978.1 condensation domain-containing protein [Rhodococcus opacus]